MEAICLKAMAPDQRERYASAQELAADLERYLADDKVVALRESLPDRVARWSRKHRAWAQAGLVGLVVISIASAGAALGVNHYRIEAESLAQDNKGLALKEERAKDAAEARRIEAETERELAVEAQSLAEQKATESLATSEFMSEAFLASDPLGTVGPGLSAAEPGKELTARDLLEFGLSNVNEKLPGHPLVRAKMLESLGVAFRSLGEVDRAEPLLLEALQIRLEEFGEHEEDVASSWHHYGWLLYDRGEFTEAEKCYRRAIEIRQRIAEVKPKSTNTASSKTAGLRLADSKFQLAWLLSVQFEAPNASHDRETESLLDEVLLLREHLPEDHRDVEGTHLLRALYRLERPGSKEQGLLNLMSLVPKSKSPLATLLPVFGLARVNRAAQRLQAAEAGYQEVRKRLGQFVGPQHPFSIMLDVDYAGLLMELDRREDAYDVIGKAIARAKKSGFRWHPALATTMLKAGDILRANHKPEEAVIYYLDALKIADKIGRVELAEGLRQRIEEFGAPW